MARPFCSASMRASRCFATGPGLARMDLSVPDDALRLVTFCFFFFFFLCAPPLTPRPAVDLLATDVATDRRDLVVVALLTLPTDAAPQGFA